MVNMKLKELFVSALFTSQSRDFPVNHSVFEKFSGHKRSLESFSPISKLHLRR